MKPACAVITWALQHRVGSLTVGDPRGALDLHAGADPQFRPAVNGLVPRPLNSRCGAHVHHAYVVDVPGRV